MFNMLRNPINNNQNGIPITKNKISAF